MRARAILFTAAKLLAGFVAVGCGSAEPIAPPSPFPERLSQAGLYRDPEQLLIANDAEYFEPRYVLWSDAASKRRWLRLPPGGVVDKSDPDHWRFPVGTRFYKEFSRDGKRLETRMIVHVADTGDRERDFRLGAYLWQEDQRDAVFVPDGAENVLGTQHDVPAANLCLRCHLGEPGNILGYSAYQLGDQEAPGDAVTSAALGTLHANCGHCHNPNGNAWAQTPMVLRLDLAERIPEDTQVYKTTVGQALNHYMSPDFTTRVVPGDPDKSALFHRASVRGNSDQMPPLATEIPDDAGLARLRAWISALR